MRIISRTEEILRSGGGTLPRKSGMLHAPQLVVESSVELSAVPRMPQASSHLILLVFCLIWFNLVDGYFPPEN